MKDNNEEKSFTAINEYELEREWVEQPELARSYNRKHAAAQRELDTAEDYLEITKAEAARDIRRNPEKYGLEKITEGAVKEALPLVKKVQTAQATVHDARFRANVLKAACIAVEHRKRALEKLVDLHLSGYFAEPRASPQAREKMDDIKKKAVRSRALKR